MSLVNAAGQPTTPEQQPQQRAPLNPAELQRIISAYARLKELNAAAYARLKELNAATIANPRDDAEKQGLVNFLNDALLANAEEFFGCWVTMHQEYTPLITGFTALLQRALSRIDAMNRVP